MVVTWASNDNDVGLRYRYDLGFNGLQVCDLLSCVYGLLYIFQNFFQLFGQPPCEQFSWSRKTASYNIFECSRVTRAPLSEYCANQYAMVCVLFGEEIITWGGMLTRLKECQGRHIEKSLLLTQTARFSKNRVRCVSQQHFIQLSTVKARVV